MVSVRTPDAFLFVLCSWFLEPWCQGSNLSSTCPFFTRLKSDAVWKDVSGVGHSNLFMAAFILNYRSHPYRWAEVVPRSNYSQSEYKTGWEILSTEDSARNWNLTMWTNSICPTQNPSRRTRRKILSDFKILTEHLIMSRWPDLVKVYKKSFILPYCEHHRPGRSQSKIEERLKKRDKYLHLARGSKTLKVTVILIVIGALGTVTEGVIKWLEELEIRTGIESIQTTTLLRSARILRIVLETWGDVLSLKL